MLYIYYTSRCSSQLSYLKVDAVHHGNVTWLDLARKRASQDLDRGLQSGADGAHPGRRGVEKLPDHGKEVLLLCWVGFRRRLDRTEKGERNRAALVDVTLPNGVARFAGVLATFTLLALVKSQGGHVIPILVNIALAVGRKATSEALPFHIRRRRSDVATKGLPGQSQNQTFCEKVPHSHPWGRRRSRSLPLVGRRGLGQKPQLRRKAPLLFFIF